MARIPTTARVAAGRAGVLFGMALVLIAAAGPGAARAATGDLPRLAAVVDSGAVFVREPGFGGGWRVGGGVFIRTGHRMGIEVLLERSGVAVEAGAADLPAAGRMTQTSLLFNEQLYVLTEGRFLPYALMGIGFSFLGFEAEAGAWPAGVAPRVFVDRMALQLGAGLDVRVSPRLAVCGRVRYNLVKTWMEDAGRTAPIRDTDPLAQNMLHLYGLELGLGLKLAF